MDQTAREQKEREKLNHFFQTNRKGVRANQPNYWRMYKATSISSTASKLTPILFENSDIEEMDESIEYLMASMKSADHIKYFIIRLKKDSNDKGFCINCMNPYYDESTYSSKMAGIGSLGNMNASNNIMMAMIGMMQSANNANMAQMKEHSENNVALMMKQNDLRMEMLEEKLLNQQKLKDLKEENAALKGQIENKGGLFGQIWGEVGPDVMDMFKYSISGQKNARDLGYKEKGNQEEEEPGGEQPKDEEAERKLDFAMELLDNNLEMPEDWILKIAMIIDNSSDEEAKMLLSLVESKYTKVKEEKQAAQNG
ncbi:hypothetical protein [Winogradskyella sp.]|uniref:hypothetical protein n=1 Tax=Winogradskyella sp. TaxID=1883156 RepID=UPI002619D2AB|nr:hypothetical protein [Winogradskyella sp.]